MTCYQLYNEEMKCLIECPTFEDKHDAELAAAGKCRRHAAVEVTEIRPCKPNRPHSGCLKCARFATREELKKSLGL